MSLSLTKSLLKLPTSNIISALSSNVISKRNISRTIPNQFFFGKKSSEFELKKVQIPNSSWKKGIQQKIPNGKLVAYEPKELFNMLRFALGT
eukprot:jgi/Orpsp1_1/1183144/evm.model.c7180000084064.1